MPGYFAPSDPKKPLAVESSVEVHDDVLPTGTQRKTHLWKMQSAFTEMLPVAAVSDCHLD